MSTRSTRGRTSFLESSSSLLVSFPSEQRVEENDRKISYTIDVKNKFRGLSEHFTHINNSTISTISYYSKVQTFRTFHNRNVS